MFWRIFISFEFCMYFLEEATVGVLELNRLSEWFDENWKACCWCRLGNIIGTVFLLLQPYLCLFQSLFWHERPQYQVLKQHWYFASSLQTVHQICLFVSSIAFSTARSCSTECFKEISSISFATRSFSLFLNSESVKSKRKLNLIRYSDSDWQKLKSNLSFVSDW